MGTPVDIVQGRRAYARSITAFRPCRLGLVRRFGPVPMGQSGTNRYTHGPYRLRASDVTSYWHSSPNRPSPSPEERHDADC